MHHPCVHHWRIDEPQGLPTVAAACLRCGAWRTFRVAFEPPADWGGDHGYDQRARAGAIDAHTWRPPPSMPAADPRASAAGPRSSP